ncbi:MAG: SIR2 family protein [Alphaproteobacteria bacterium]|nr:SIR2 family protein [Alphaproteobacteria bacterium]
MSAASPPLAAALRGVAEGSVVPYLGAGVAALGGGEVPASPTALATIIEAQVRPPRRAAGNLWAVAQFVETRRHRRTVAAIVERAFARPAGDNPIHRWLAAVRPPLVVDAWYDAGLVDAYAAADDEGWGRVQAVSRHDVRGEAWTRAFDARGEPCPDGPDPAWPALIYKPHGLARAGSSFLLSDSDYVPVLTEIDIQTPIPTEVQARRRGRGFLFLGCRFDDQMLRMFARQIAKRSGGPHLAVLDGPLSRMEARFLEAEGIARVDLDLADVAAALPAGR